ncbi:MAG: hypothetical protein EXR78_04985 [Deltaproteobacteria bacterium]|nr:hypothetical protein [Deltaproteobacteria bacterium]
MKLLTLLALTCLAVSACAQPQNPAVRAARDLQRLADDLVSYEEERSQRFQSIELGMSSGEVIKILGAPAAQRLIEEDEGERREEWTYRAALRPLGTLMFVNRKVVEIRTE